MKRCSNWCTAVGQCQDQGVVQCACQDNIKLRTLGWYAFKSRIYCPACTRFWLQHRDIAEMIATYREHMCGQCRAELGTASGGGRASPPGRASSRGRASGGASSFGSQLSPTNQSAALIAACGQLDELTRDVRALAECHQLYVQRVTTLESLQVPQHQPNT